MLSAKEKWTYAIGNMPFAVKEAAYGHFVVFFYTQVHGLSGTLTGLAMFIAISWDAVSDPVVGSWSDSFRSRWGRRHPLMVLGAIPTAVLCLALFTPPQQFGEAGVFVWLLVVSILLRSFLTIYFIPYSAMGAELSSDYDERTVIAKARVTVAWVAGMALPAIGFAVFFQPQSGLDGRFVAGNYVYYGMLSAIVAGVTAVICIVGTRSVIPRLPENKTKRKFSWRDPLQDFKLVLENRNFRLSMSANLAFGMSSGVYATLSLYLSTYFWELSSDQLAGMIVPAAVATAAAFVVVNKLGKRFDKPLLLATLCLVLAANSAWLIGGRLLGLLPPNDHFIIYPLILVHAAVSVFVIVCIQILTVSLAADILDEHNLATGRRLEGVVFAAKAFVLKATSGIGVLIAGFVIDLVGLTPDDLPGSVAANVLQSLGWFALAVTSALALCAFWFNSRLTLSRDQHALVRMQLGVRGDLGV